VFLNSHRWVTPENAIKQKNRGKTDIEIFVDLFRKSFRHGLFVKTFCGLWCFWTPLAEKRPKTY
jgi:hypothetical protein